MRHPISLMQNARVTNGIWGNIEYLRIDEKRLFVVYASSSILPNHPSIFVTPFVPRLVKTEI